MPRTIWLTGAQSTRVWGTAILITVWRITHSKNEELQAPSRRREERKRRGFQALFSGAHQRASRNGPSHDEARPWWGVSRGLSGDFMYITIPEAGTRAVHCWLTGRRSRRSRSRPRGASRRVHAREKEWKSVFRVHFSKREIVPPLRPFLLFYRGCAINNAHARKQNRGHAWTSTWCADRSNGAINRRRPITSIQDDRSRVVPLRHRLVPRGEQSGLPHRAHTRYARFSAN